MDVGHVTRSTSPPALEPSALKFTAVKVSLSSLTSRRKQQVVVISNETSSRDLIEMVVKKARMEKEQVQYISLAAFISHQRPHNGEVMTSQRHVLHDEDRPLLLYDGLPKGSVSFTLEWREEDQIQQTQQISVDPGESRKGTNMADTAERLRASLQKNIMRYNPWSRDSAEPEVQSDSGSADEFLVHYEPCSSSSHSSLSPDPLDTQEWSSIGDLSELPGYRSSHRSRPGSNQSDSLLDWQRTHGRTNKKDKLMEARLGKPAPLSNTSRQRPLRDRSLNSSDSSGASVAEECILFGEGDDCTDITGYASTGVISRGDSGVGGTLTELSSSLPNILKSDDKRLRLVPINGQTESSDSVMKRSLPDLDETVVQEKRKLVAEKFSRKLRQFMTKSPVNHKLKPRCGLPDDDAMSMTSLEVADILREAPPMAPSDDEDENNEEFCSGDETDTCTLDGESPPVVTKYPSSSPIRKYSSPSPVTKCPSPSPLTKYHSLSPEKTPEFSSPLSPTDSVSKSDSKTTSKTPEQKVRRLSRYVEQSMMSFFTNVKLSPSSSSTDNSDGRRNMPSGNSDVLDEITLFDLLQNFKLLTVRGIFLFNLKDRFVKLNSHSGEKTCQMVCVVDYKHLSAPTIGYILKGDYIVEINGRRVINATSDHVLQSTNQCTAHIVIARPLS